MEVYSRDQILSQWLGARDAVLYAESRLEDLCGFIESKVPMASQRLAAFFAADAVAQVSLWSRANWAPVEPREYSIGGPWRGDAETMEYLQTVSDTQRPDKDPVDVLNSRLVATFGELPSLRKRQSYPAVIEMAVGWLGFLNRLQLPSMLPANLERYVQAVPMSHDV
jgi:hypothetical protein